MKGIGELRRHPWTQLALLAFCVALWTGGFFWWESSTILLKADGSTRKVHAKGLTVADTLQAENLQLKGEDYCVPVSSTPIKAVKVIVVTRVSHRVETDTQRSTPKISWRVDLKANLRPVVVEWGTVRQETRTIRYTLHDGIKVSGWVLHHKVAVHPIFTLTLIGKKTNYPVKTYNLLKAKKLEMRATGYFVGERTVPSDTTFLGYKLRRGLVAVDPTVIPLHTRLYVKGYGYAYAADTGSAIKGNRIDLAVADRKEEAKFNRKKIEVYVLEKAKNW